MKIIDAVWERRNLGMDVTEITLEWSDLKEADTIEILKKRMIRGHYLLVKIPVGDIAFLIKLQALGFIFLECQYNISKKLHNYASSSQLKILPAIDQIFSEPLSEDTKEWDELCYLIGDDMYTTDRISLDPIFNLTVANRRYQNWIKDIQGNSSTVVAKIKYEEKAIGFFVESFDLHTRAVYYMLFGLFKPYQNSGLGLSAIHAPLKFGADREMRSIYSQISSNNKVILRSYLFWGFSIDNTSYVLRYYSI